MKMWRSILCTLRSETQAFFQCVVLTLIIEDGNSVYALVSVLSLLIKLSHRLYVSLCYLYFMLFITLCVMVVRLNYYGVRVIWVGRDL